MFVAARRHVLGVSKNLFRLTQSVNSCRNLQGFRTFSQTSWCLNETRLSSSYRSRNDLSQINLKNVEVDEKFKVVKVTLSDGYSFTYPIVWLRDNCLCEKCFEPNSNGRIINLQQFRTDNKISKATIKGATLCLEWDDGHESIFSNNWLCQHSFHLEHRDERVNQFHPPKLSWNAKSFVYERFLFQDIMNDDSSLLKWLESLAQYGVAIITETPQDNDQVNRLAARISFQRRTLYGTVFHVKNVKNAYNLAYRVGPLQFHTDIPHYHHMPGVNLLHCVVQSTTGGENTLCDGINVVRQLPPKHYRILSETMVDWVDKGEEDNLPFHIMNRAPVICETPDGRLDRINWNQGIRDSVFNVSVERAIEWYEAMKVFSDIIHDPDNSAVLKTHPGDILTFDNTRILHGRQNYSDGERHLIGAYMDWDEIYSRIRALRTKLQTC